MLPRTLTSKMRSLSMSLMRRSKSGGITLRYNLNKKSTPRQLGEYLLILPARRRRDNAKRETEVRGEVLCIAFLDFPCESIWRPLKSWRKTGISRWRGTRKLVTRLMACILGAVSINFKVD